MPINAPSGGKITKATIRKKPRTTGIRRLFDGNGKSNAQQQMATRQYFWLF